MLSNPHHGVALLTGFLLIACAATPYDYTNSLKKLTVPTITPHKAQAGDDVISFTTKITGKLLFKDNCLYIKSRSSGKLEDYLLIWHDHIDVKFIPQGRKSAIQISSNLNTLKTFGSGDNVDILGTFWNFDEIHPAIQKRFQLSSHSSWEQLNQDCDAQFFKTVSNVHAISRRKS